MTESALLRVIIGLVLVVAAILASAWLARRAGLVRAAAATCSSRSPPCRWAPARASWSSKWTRPGWWWA